MGTRERKRYGVVREADGLEIGPGLRTLVGQRPCAYLCASYAEQSTEEPGRASAADGKDAFRVCSLLLKAEPGAYGGGACRD